MVTQAAFDGVHHGGLAAEDAGGRAETLQSEQEKDTKPT